VKLVFFTGGSDTKSAITEDRFQDLVSLFPDDRPVLAADEDALVRELADAEVLYSNRVKAAYFTQAPALRWVHVPKVGIEEVFREGIAGGRFQMSSARGIYAVPMAEHVIAMLFLLARRWYRVAALQREGRWSQEEGGMQPPVPEDLEEKTLGILGYGDTGRAIAKRARPFGMRILGVKHRTEIGTEGADEIFPLDGLRTVLQESDFVVMLLPSSDQTRRILGVPEFRCMKQSAFFLNISRGNVIDEPALIGALETGAIAGAALDVFAEEPLRLSSPLWHMPNVIITPHNCNYTESFWRRNTERFGENLRRLKAGEPLIAAIDPALGY